MKKFSSVLIAMATIMIIYCFICIIPAIQSEKETQNSSASSSTVSEDDGLHAIECDNISATINPKSRFTALDPSEYYQYSLLNDVEKKIYGKINEAVKKCEISVDISQYAVDYNRAIDLVQIFMADNPQYFYLSKYINVTHFADSDTANEIRLLYTDGTVTDKITNHTLTVQADRAAIERQIDEFNGLISEVLSTIPENLSQSHCEKIIHDYIATNITYDTEVANADDDNNTQYRRAYDAYGAICEKKAVCEGYSKLFQYLCYCVGINANQVIGEGNGGSHMWNVVQISGKWYHIDVTWACPKNGSNIYYDYYNIPWYKMSIDHTITCDYLAVPS